MATITWHDKFNNFTNFVKNAYGIKLPNEAPTTFSRDYLLYNWDCYIWLKQQLDENDKTKLSQIRDFLNNSQYHHFIVGFIRSGFLPNEDCELYAFFDLIFIDETRMSITSPNATQHSNENQRRKYNERFDTRLKIIKSEMKICNDKYDGCNKIKWTERDKVSKYFHNCNTTFHRCCGVLQFARERKLWVEFNKTVEVEQFFSRIATHGSPANDTRIDRVIRLLSIKISKNADNCKTIFHTMSYYNNLYRTNTGQMACKVSRDKWKAFYDLHKDTYHMAYRKCDRKRGENKPRTELATCDKQQCTFDDDVELLDDATFNNYVNEFYVDANDMDGNNTYSPIEDVFVSKN